VLRLFSLILFAALVAASPTPSPLPHLTITENLLAGLPHRTVTVTEENGESATYSGVDLGVLLANNGAPHGEAIHGAAAADYVVVHASDGYRAVFALVELDPRFTDKIVLLADKRNGAPMGSDLGPFHIVVPDEKHHARWVRNVTDVSVESAPLTP
jgi:hypothetical protein